MANTKTKIVIADDEPDILNLLSILFRSKGYEVLSASDGETALNLIETANPSAAILDFMMPKMDGISVCERVRQNNNNLFIVIISGVGSDELKLHSDRAQADEYLEKPLRMAALVEKIKAGIARQANLKEATS
jgi:two-component system alkaline phosphatase synthesis response regulator PhoP